MATLIQMFCPECDYTTEILRFGPTWSDRRNLGPALDSEALQVVEIDYDDLQHAHIVPYTNRQLQPKTGGAGNGDLVLYAPEHGRHYALKKNNNFCPGCNGYSLNIDVFGMAD